MFVCQNKMLIHIIYLYAVTVLYTEHVNMAEVIRQVILHVIFLCLCSENNIVINAIILPIYQCL